MNLPIPKLEMYYPSEDRMNKKQLQFYQVVEKQLSAGQFIEIDGNIGYVFTYLYKVLERFEKLGAKTVYENLIHISELYAHVDHLRRYCIFWAGECLLAERQYERFLVETETNQVWKGSTFPELRLNLRRVLSLDQGWEIDLVKLFGARSSTFIKKNEAIYQDFLVQNIQGYVNEKGGWKKYFKWLANGSKPYEHWLFGGSTRPKVPMPDLVYSLQGQYTELKAPLHEICKQSENQAREHLGLPAIGEGWISETELFKDIQRNFPQTEVVQHGKPHFLGRQHYDIWMPQWRVAVEFHGLQHFEAIEFFGGEEAFKRNIERDQRKIALSNENGVHLFVVTHGYDLPGLLVAIAATRESNNYGLIDLATLVN